MALLVNTSVKPGFLGSAPSAPGARVLHCGGLWLPTGSSAGALPSPTEMMLAPKVFKHGHMSHGRQSQNPGREPWL